MTAIEQNTYYFVKECKLKLLKGAAEFQLLHEGQIITEGNPKKALL